MKQFLALLVLFFLCTQTQAQTCIVKGRVYNSTNNEPIPFAVVVAKGAGLVVNATTDLDGKYEISVEKPGIFNLEAILVGFKTNTIYEVLLKPDRPTLQDIPLIASTKDLGEVTISADPFFKREESPISLNTIGVSEIKRNPGGNRDISKVIQSLPGVTSLGSFRNDLIVRGGSPNENRFYLDGIEVPNINHFATQGASGGPVGMLNVDFINSVDFYSGAFPANRGNTLSSVMDFKYKDGRTDKPAYTVTLGATDLAATFDGPITDKSTLIASYRRSYLQFLAAALQFSFLPTYNDFQFKYKFKPNTKNEFTFIGLGAYDVFKLNKDANETEQQLYDLGNLPENNQWNYAIGGNYRNYRKNGYLTVVLSRNKLNNQSTKYQDNDENDPSKKVLDYVSEETENKFRIENTSRLESWKVNYGIALEKAEYTNTTFNRLPNVGTVNFNSEIDFYKYAGFGQVSKTFAKQGLVLSFGARIDANTFGNNMKNPLEQFSPRFSASYSITDKLTFNANTGIYYQLPAYTILGFRNNAGELANKDVKYIRSSHLVAGFEYLTRSNSRFTVEGFYKKYENYPFSITDSISIANLGSDFGVVGNTFIDSRSKGRSYGVEFSFQQKLFKNYFALLNYTLVKSEFTNLTDKYTPSSWDFRHNVSLTAGRIFKKNWELGAKLRFNSGGPYTPYDKEKSALKVNWDITKQGINDNTQINSLRNDYFSQLDIRIDKKYFYKKWTLNVFLDIQNIFNNILVLRPNLTTVNDANGNPITDPNKSDSYLLKELENTSGTILPTIGVIVEF